MAEVAQQDCSRSNITYENTLAIRFILLIIIFMFTAGDHYNFNFPAQAYIPISVFFFFTGFGLQISLETKSRYLATFMQKRVLGVVLRQWWILVFMTLVCLIMTTDLQRTEQLMTTNFLESPSCFIIELLMFYIVFYLSCFIRTERWRMHRSLFITASTVAIMFFMSGVLDSDLYYISAITFALGSVWGIYHVPVTCFIRRWMVVLVPIVGIAMLFSYRTMFGLQDAIFASTTAILTSTMFAFVLLMDLRIEWYMPLMLMLCGFVIVYITGDPWTHHSRLDYANIYYTNGPFMMLTAGVAGIVCWFSQSRQLCAFFGAMSLEMYLVQYYMFDCLEGFEYEPMMMVLLCWVLTLVISLFLYVVMVKVKDWMYREIDRTLNLPPE